MTSWSGAELTERERLRETVIRGERQDLTGQTLHVVDELRGSLRFERHLLALDHLTP